MPQVFPVAQIVKESACDTRDLGSIPRAGISSGEENGNPLQHLAWRIPWTEEPGRLQSMESKSWTQMNDLTL